MKTSRFWGYFAKVGLGAGVAVTLGGAPILAHAEDNEPLPAIETGSQATQNAATKAGEATGNAANQAGSAASGAANQAGSAASGAADQAGSAATSAADKATGTADDSSITDALKGKLEKAGSDASDIKVDTDNGVVTLSGTVHQESTRTNAVKMAKQSKGVKSVKDQIEVLPAK
jgi:osmotically-inducible protein OsmY